MADYWHLSFRSQPRFTFHAPFDLGFPFFGLTSGSSLGPPTSLVYCVTYRPEHVNVCSKIRFRFWNHVVIVNVIRANLITWDTILSKRENTTLTVGAGQHYVLVVKRTGAFHDRSLYSPQKFISTLKSIARSLQNRIISRKLHKNARVCAFFRQVHIKLPHSAKKKDFVSHEQVWNLFTALIVLSHFCWGLELFHNLPGNRRNVKSAKLGVGVWGLRFMRWAGTRMFAEILKEVLETKCKIHNVSSTFNWDFFGILPQAIFPQ